jgi:hypothetical protein
MPFPINIKQPLQKLVLMTPTIKNLLILCLFIILSSCEQKEQKKENVREKISLSNEKAIKDFIYRNNAISGWDTLACYTYRYQEMFIDSARKISFEGNIRDIIKSDSNYFIKISYSELHNIIYHQIYRNNHFLAEIMLTRGQFLSLKQKLKSKNSSRSGCFIFKVSKIVTLGPEIKTDLKGYSEDVNIYLDFDFTENLILFKGTLVDCIIKQSGSTYDLDFMKRKPI